MVENGSSDAPHVDEGTLHAWLDGALPANESRAVEAHVATCESCAAAAAEARGLIAASTRILSALDDVPGDVVPAAFNTQSLTSRRAKSRSVRAYASIAAAAVVVVALSLVVRGKTTPVTRQDSSVAVRPIEADTTSAPVTQSPEGPESQVAVASSARKPANHIDARKPRVPSPAVPKSQVAVAPESQAQSAPIVTGVAAAAATAPSADSLTVTGRVTAAATGLPLGDARVSVVGTDAVVATDSTGTFKVSVPPTGSHVLMARRIGFAANSAIVNLPADRVAQVTLALPSQPTALAEVVTGGVLQRTRGFAKPLPEIAGARVVSSNVSDAGGSRIRRTTFQLDSGATVTLVEIRSLAAAPAAEDRPATPARADTQTRAGRVMLRGRSELSAASAPSVTWIAADSTVMILSGPLSTRELDELRKRIVP